MITEIIKIEKKAEAIAGTWDGKDTGTMEDRAKIAIEIIYKCSELRELVEELENTN